MSGSIVLLNIKKRVNSLKVFATEASELLLEFVKAKRQYWDKVYNGNMIHITQMINVDY